MKDHRLAFTPWSVAGVRAHRKTQTRRLIVDSNSQGNYRASELLLADPLTFVDGGPSPAGNPGPYLHAKIDVPAVVARRGAEWKDEDPEIVDRLYPRVFVGDHILALESFRGFDLDGGRFRVEYRDGEAKEVDVDRLMAASGRVVMEQMIRLGHRFPKWQTPRFMPRWAVRLVLELIEVRAQRIQEVSEEDAIAEGIRSWTKDGSLYKFGTIEPGDPGATPWQDMERTARDAFAALWGHLHPESWERNDWAWAYTFRRLEETADGR